MFNWIVVGVALAALAIYWYVKGREEKATETLETTPPCDPIQMGYMLDGMISERTVVAAILYWANKGHLEINDGHIRIISVPEKIYEERLFRALFKNNKSVEIGALSIANTFGVDREIGESLNEKFYAGTAPFKSLENYIYAAAWVLMGGYKNLLALLLFFFLNWVAVVILKRQITEIRSSEKVVFTNQTLAAILLLIIAWMCGPMYIMGATTLKLVQGTILFLGGTFLLAIMDKHSNTYLYGRVKGYGDYLKTAEYENFTTLRKTDPQYGNDVLPYLVLFGMGTPETNAYVEAISKTDEEASRITRYSYLDSLNLDEFKKEPFEMRIQKKARLLGVTIINGPIESGMLTWESKKSDKSSILVSDIRILVPLVDGTQREAKVDQIAVEEDNEATVDMAVKSDHISFSIRGKGININNIKEGGVVTLVSQK